MDLRLPPAARSSLPEDVLDYCPRNNDSRNKNRPSRKYRRSREKIDREEILSTTTRVPSDSRKDGDVSIKRRWILSKQKAISNYFMNYYENFLPFNSSRIIFSNYIFIARIVTRFSFPPRTTNCVYAFFTAALKVSCAIS